MIDQIIIKVTQMTIETRTDDLGDQDHQIIVNEDLQEDQNHQVEAQEIEKVEAHEEARGIVDRTEDADTYQVQTQQGHTHPIDDTIHHPTPQDGIVIVSYQVKEKIIQLNHQLHHRQHQWNQQTQ